MCFSAAVSFGASAVLTGTGVVAIKKSKSPGMLPIASTPILFGIQQFSEGMLWLSFKNPEWVSLQKPSIFVFLFIAQVAWPAWAPLATWWVEPDKAKKKILSWFAWLGVATSAFLFYSLLISDVSAIVESRHIRYFLNFPLMDLRRVLYFLTTVVPIFISSLKFMKWFGATMLGSLILAFIIYTHYVVSVWCFFAAVLSILVLLIIVKNNDIYVESPRHDPAEEAPI